jgi:hypothetical protein
VAYRKEIHDAIATLNHARFMLAKAIDRWDAEPNDGQEQFEK